MTTERRGYTMRGEQRDATRRSCSGRPPLESDRSSTVEREDTTLGARPGCRRGTPAIRSHFLPPASIGQLLAVLPYYPGLDADKPAKAASKRICAPGAQWARQGSHAWLLRLFKSKGRLAALPLWYQAA